MSNMRTAWNIFKQNVATLARDPKAVAACVAVVLLSCLFAWYAVGSLWNPYSNTGRLKVAVVNQDAGMSSSEFSAKAAAVGVDAGVLGDAAGEGDIVLGRVLTDALAQNGGLDWQFVSAEQARSGLASGDYYAEFVLPEGFTAEFLNMLSQETTRPVVEYRISDKHGQVILQANGAALVEDSGSDAAEGPSALASLSERENAGTVDAVVERSFTSAAAQAFSEAMKSAASTLTAKGGTSSSGLDTGLDGATKDLDAVETNLNRAKDSIELWRTAAQASKETLDALRKAAPDLRDSLAKGTEELASARTAAHEVASAYGSAFALGDEGFASMLEDVANRVEGATEPLTEAQKSIDSEISAAEKALSQCEKLIAALAKADPDSSTVASLKEQNEKLQADIANLKKDSQALSTAMEGARSASDSLSSDAAEAIESLKGRTDTFNKVILPQLDVSLDALALVMGSLDGALGSMDAEVAQMKTLLDELEGVLQKTEDATKASFDALETAKSDLSTARSDVSALANAKAVQEASSLAIFSEQSARAAMAPSIDVEVQQLYSPGSYGAGMAPLYANLALWAVCLMLMLVVKTEANPLRFLRIRPWQSYLGRLLPIGFLALIQSVVLVVGYLVLGVQATSVIALVAAGLAVAFCTVNVVFALDAVFVHAGKAVAVLLIAAQACWAFGVYPAQLEPEALQAIGSWLPLTHGVNVMGEAIGGFHGLAYVQELLWLLACGLVTFALAQFLQPRALTLNRLFARKFEHADLFAGDEGALLANAPGSFFAGGVAASRSNLEEELFMDDRFFEDEQEQALLLMRARKYAQRYAIVRNAIPLAAVAFVAALIVLSLALPLSANDKLLALALFLVAAAAVCVVCLAFENAYDKMTAQLAAAGVDTSGLENARVVAPVISAPVVAVPEAEDVLIQPTLEGWEPGAHWSGGFAAGWDEGDRFEEDDLEEDGAQRDGAEGSEDADRETHDEDADIVDEDASDEEREEDPGCDDGRFSADELEGAQPDGALEASSEDELPDDGRAGAEELNEGLGDESDEGGADA